MSVEINTSQYQYPHSPRPSHAETNTSNARGIGIAKCLLPASQTQRSPQQPRLVLDIEKTSI